MLRGIRPISLLRSGLPVAKLLRQKKINASTIRLFSNMESIPVGPVPVQRKCPCCGNSIVSRIEHKPSAKTHLIAVILFVSLCLPCVFVPYCTDTCKNVDHYCPNCNGYLGTYKH